MPSVLQHSLDALVARSDSAQIIQDVRQDLEKAFVSSDVCIQTCTWTIVCIVQKEREQRRKTDHTLQTKYSLHMYTYSVQQPQYMYMYMYMYMCPCGSVNSILSHKTHSQVKAFTTFDPVTGLT